MSLADALATDPLDPGPVYEPTTGELLFDVHFGILLPVVCLIADPVVFRSNFFGFSIAGQFAIFGWLVTITGIALLAFHLWKRRPSAWLAGGLAACAAFSTALGVVMLPFSFLGLIVVIGVLGFTPFLSAYVFWRTAKAAWPPSRGPGRPGRVSCCAGFVLVLLLPALLQAGASLTARTCMERVLAGHSTRATIATLQVLKFGQELDVLVSAYLRETDTPKKEALSRDYRGITGRSIEDRLARLAD